MAIPFLRLQRWTQGAFRSADDLMTLAQAPLVSSFGAATWRNRFAGAAVRAGVVPSPRSSATGAFTDGSDAPLFHVWCEGRQEIVPWREWVARKATFNMPELSLMAWSVLVSSRVNLTRISDAKGFGVRAGPDGVAEGSCIALVPLCSSVTLFDDSQENVVLPSEPPSNIIRQHEMFDLVHRLTTAARDDASTITTLHREYRHAVATTVLQRATSAQEYLNLMLCEPRDAAQRQRLHELVLALNSVRRPGGALDGLHWEQIIGATSACMSRTNALPAPFHSGILPFVHNINHSCAPNAVVTTGPLSVETGALEVCPDVQLDRALILCAAANELGVDGDLAEWAAVVAMPSVEVVAIKPVQPGEEICVTYHHGGEDDTIEDVKNTFLDHHGFEPSTTDPKAARDIILNAHDAARRWRQTRRRVVAAM